MATLSANSRRNSATSSVSNSPRPSLTGNNTVTSGYSLPEPIIEEILTDHADNDSGGVNGLPKKNTCTERSDSGFSDCSNSSGNAATNGASHTHTIHNQNSHSLFDKAYSISEEKSHIAEDWKEIGGKLSVNMLKLKLEKLAEAQNDAKVRAATTEERVKPVNKLSMDQFDVIYGNDAQPVQQDESTLTKEFTAVPKYDIHEKNVSDSNQKKSANRSLVRSASLQHKKVADKEPIMKSDFTNTVKMRKKSLETSANKEKLLHSPRALFESSGKVSKLLQRFNSDHFNPQNLSIAATNTTAEPIVETPDGKNNSPIDFTAALQANNVETEAVDSIPLDMTNAPENQTITTKTVTRMSRASASSVSVSKNKTRAKSDSSPRISPRMERRSVFDRLSPTKFTNASNINQSISRTNANKMSIKTNAADAMATRKAGTAITSVKSTSPTSALKTSAHSSLHRTSPVRLSGRVKEVTDRLSTPKTIKRPIAIHPTVQTLSGFNNVATASTKSSISSSASMSLITTVTSTAVMEQTVTNSISVDRHQKIISNKIEGDFAAKSKMNENFKKASAFWKAT